MAKKNIIKEEIISEIQPEDFLAAGAACQRKQETCIGSCEPM
jgi:hypothetical protein